MRAFSCLLLVLFSAWSYGKDPFHLKVNSGFKRDQKYQYLGFIKGPKVFYGFIRRSGGEVERLDFGKNPGFGQIILLNQQRICMTKLNKVWCLLKSSQAKPWVLES